MQIVGTLKTMRLLCLCFSRPIGVALTANSWNGRSNKPFRVAGNWTFCRQKNPVAVFHYYFNEKHSSTFRRYHVTATSYKQMFWLNERPLRRTCYLFKYLARFIYFRWSRPIWLFKHWPRLAIYFHCFSSVYWLVGHLNERRVIFWFQSAAITWRPSRDGCSVWPN